MDSDSPIPDVKALLGRDGYVFLPAFEPDAASLTRELAGRTAGQDGQNHALTDGDTP
jgi:hypothetical protein